MPKAEHYAVHSFFFHHLKLMVYERPSFYRHHGLWNVFCQRPDSCSKPSCKYRCLHHITPNLNNAISFNTLKIGITLGNLTKPRTGWVTSLIPAVLGK